MDAKQIIDAYFQFIAEHGPQVFSDYTRNVLWTPWATRALMHVGLRAFPEGEAAACGHASGNQWGRSEWMGLDVTICEPKTWTAPLFIAEHENSASKAQVQYCAWKLLSVESRRRVLVAYWGKGTEFKTFEAMTDAVREVCEGQHGKDILLIGGDYAAKPTNKDEFRAAHSSHIVGVHTFK